MAMPESEEPLFTIGEEPRRDVARAPDGRPRLALAIVALLVVAGAFALLRPDQPLDGDRPQPDVELPDPVQPRVIGEWSWSPIPSRSADTVIWAGSGVALVDRPWSPDAGWSFTADAITWTAPVELAYNPIASISTTSARAWSPVLFGSSEGSDWRLDLLAGIPATHPVGSVAVFQDVVVVASTAPWARIDWTDRFGGGTGVPPEVVADGGDVVVSASGGWPVLARLSAEHDREAAELRLVDGDGSVRVRLRGVPEVSPPQEPQTWIHHGVVPQRLLVGTLGADTYRSVDPPWIGEASVTSTGDGFVALAVSPDAKGVEVWRSVSGREWTRVDGALLTAVPIESVRAAGGATSVVGEFCTAVECTRLVYRDGLWWEDLTGAPPFPVWNGSEWWATDGTSVWLSPDAITWEQVDLPPLAGTPAGTFVLAGEQIVVATRTGDELGLTGGRRDAADVRG